MHRRHALLAFLLLVIATNAGSAVTGQSYGQQAPSATALPTAVGTLVSGSTLTATQGTWTGVSIQTYAYEWHRCDLAGNACFSIVGATQTSYKVGSADVGRTIRVSVTATNKNGSGIATSAQTGVIEPPPTTAAPSNTAPPQITGSAQTGQILSVSTGTWTGSPTSYEYAWHRCSLAGTSCSSVSGAMGATYLLTSADVDTTLHASVTATNAGGSATADSAETAAVAGASTTDVYSRPVPRYGISPSFSILQDSPSDQAWEVARWVDLGAQAVRFDYVTGTYWETVADSVISQALAAGLEPELCIGCNIKYPWTKTASQYGADCSRAATKYHGRVRYYEVLNEPNGSWNGPWDPTTYVLYLKACYQAVKTVDPRNQVLLGGITPAPSPGIDAVPWVQKLYAAGAKGYYDVMNMHNYGDTDPYLKATWSMWCKTFGCSGVVSPSVVDVMAQYGDSGKPIVSTEGGVNSDSVGETQQAAIVDHYLRYPDPRFKTAYVYCVWCGTGFSLTRTDKTYKPAYTAYKTDAHS